MWFCCITSCRVRAPPLALQDGPVQRPWRRSYLVQDVSLAAQVQVGQDPGGTGAADGEAGLGDAGRNQNGLPLTQTREEPGELQEAT